MRARICFVSSRNVATRVQHPCSGMCSVNGAQHCLPNQGEDLRANCPWHPSPGNGAFPRAAQPCLLILPPSKLTQVQQQQVAQMNLNEDLRAVSQLSQEFVTLLKERQAEALDSWLKRAKACHVTELGSNVFGIRRDYAAVRAAFCPDAGVMAPRRGMSTGSNF